MIHRSLHEISVNFVILSADKYLVGESRLLSMGRLREAGETMSIADELAKPDALRQSSVLTQAEFDAEKAKLIRGIVVPPVSHLSQPKGDERRAKDGGRPETGSIRTGVSPRLSAAISTGFGVTSCACAQLPRSVSL